MDPVVALLSDLVAIDSVNPSLIEGGAGEAAIAQFISAWMRGAGFDVRLDEIAAGRVNVIATADGDGAGPTRMLCGHTDTVGADGMAAPFSPAIRDGRLYGLGAQDMKGGVAAMMAGAAHWLQSGHRGSGRVIVAAVADEEYASIGAEALAREWRADEAVIPEPTDLDVGIAHKGFSCAEVIVRGRAAHGSRPADGRDAILRMGRLLNRIEAKDRSLQSTHGHVLLGAPSMHTGTISGGSSLSTYPADCVLQVERRTVAGERTGVCVEELQQMAAALRAEDPEFECEIRLLLARPPYLVSPDADVLHTLGAAVNERFGARPMKGLSYWTDAAILGEAGTPTVIFGPRGAGLHSADEYVEIDDVIGCRDVFASWLAMSRLATPRTYKGRA
jgi:acetylornithine deacetylase